MPSSFIVSFLHPISITRHYSMKSIDSGHGAQHEDEDGDEKDGIDEG